MGNTVAISQTDTNSYYKQAATILQTELKHYELLKHDPILLQSSKVSFSFLAYSLNDYRLPVLVKLFLKPDYFTSRFAQANENSQFDPTITSSRSIQQEIEEMKRDLTSLNTAIAQIKFSVAPTQIYKETDQYLITVRQYFHSSLSSWVNMHRAIKSTHIIDNDLYNPQLSNTYSTNLFKSPQLQHLPTSPPRPQASSPIHLAPPKPNIFLSKTTHTDKKWIAFQLLTLVSQFHTLGMVHGDIKPSNLALTTSNWLFLTDFALHKPVAINLHDPSQYYHGFASPYGDSGCYLAPERFVVLDPTEASIISRRPIPTQTQLIPFARRHARLTTPATSNPHFFIKSTTKPRTPIDCKEISHVEFIPLTETPLYRFLIHISEAHHQDRPISILGGRPKYANVVDEGLEVATQSLSSQFDGSDVFSSKVNVSMDIFSIGCVLYYLYTGEHLFTHTSLLSYAARNPDSFPSEQLSLSKLPNLTLLVVISHMIQLDATKRLNLHQYLFILTSKLAFFPSWFHAIRQFFFNIYCNVDFSTTDASVSILRKSIPLLIKKIFKSPQIIPYLQGMQVNDLGVLENDQNNQDMNDSDAKNASTNNQNSTINNPLQFLQPDPSTQLIPPPSAPTAHSAKQRLTEMIHAKPFFQDRKDRRALKRSNELSQQPPQSLQDQHQHQHQHQHQYGSEPVGEQQPRNQQIQDQPSLTGQRTPGQAKNRNVDQNPTQSNPRTTTPSQIPLQSQPVHKHEVEHCCWELICQHHELSNQLLHHTSANFEVHQYHALLPYQSSHPPLNTSQFPTTISTQPTREIPTDTETPAEAELKQSTSPPQLASIIATSPSAPLLDQTYIPDQSDHPALLFITPILAQIRHATVSNTIGLIDILSLLIDSLMDFSLFQQTYSLADVDYHDFVIAIVKPLLLTKITPFYVSLMQASLSFYDPVLSTSMIKLSSDLGVLSHPYFNFSQKYPLITSELISAPQTKDTLSVDPRTTSLPFTTTPSSLAATQSTSQLFAADAHRDTAPLFPRETAIMRDSAGFASSFGQMSQNGSNSTIQPSPTPVLIHTVHSPPLIPKTSETVLYQRQMAQPVTPFSVPLVIALLHALIKITTLSITPSSPSLIRSVLQSFGYDLSRIGTATARSAEQDEKARSDGTITNPTPQPPQSITDMLSVSELISTLSLAQKEYFRSFFLQFHTVEDFYIITALILPLLTVTVQHHSVPIVTTTLALLPKLVLQLQSLTNTLYSQLTLQSRTISDFSQPIDHIYNSLNSSLNTLTSNTNDLASTDGNYTFDGLLANQKMQPMHRQITLSNPPFSHLVSASHFNPYDLSFQQHFHQLLIGLFQHEYRPIALTSPQNEQIKILHRLHSTLLQSILAVFTSTINTPSSSPILHTLLQQTPLFSLIFGQKIQNTTLLPLSMSLFGAQSTSTTKAFLFSYIHYYFSVFSTRQVHVATQTRNNSSTSPSALPPSKPRLQTLVHLNSLNTFTQLLAPCFEQAFFDSNQTVVFAALSSFLTIIKLTRLSAVQHGIHLFDKSMQDHMSKIYGQSPLHNPPADIIPDGSTNIPCLEPEHVQNGENGDTDLKSVKIDQSGKKLSNPIFDRVNAYSKRIMMLYEEHNIELSKDASKLLYTYQNHTQIYTTLFELLRQALIHLISPYKSIRLLLLRIINTITSPLYFGPSQLSSQSPSSISSSETVIPLKAHAYLHLHGTMSLFLASQYRPRMKFIATIPAPSQSNIQHSQSNQNALYPSASTATSPLARSDLLLTPSSTQRPRNGLVMAPPTPSTTPSLKFASVSRSNSQADLDATTSTDAVTTLGQEQQDEAMDQNPQSPSPLPSSSPLQQNPPIHPFPLSQHAQVLLQTPKKTKPNTTTTNNSSSIDPALSIQSIPQSSNQNSILTQHSSYTQNSTTFPNSTDDVLTRSAGEGETESEDAISQEDIQYEEQLELLRKTFLTFDTQLLPYLSLPPLSMRTFNGLKNGQLPSMNEFDPNSPTLSVKWRIQQYFYYQQYNKLHFGAATNHHQLQAAAPGTPSQPRQNQHRLLQPGQLDTADLNTPRDSQLSLSASVSEHSQAQSHHQPTQSATQSVNSFSQTRSVTPSESRGHSQHTTQHTDNDNDNNNNNNNNSALNLGQNSLHHHNALNNGEPITFHPTPHIWIPETPNKEKLHQVLTTWSNAMHNRSHTEQSLVQQHLQLQRQNLYEQTTQHQKQIYFSQIYVLQSVLKQVAFQHKTFGEQFERTKQKELLTQKEEEYRRQVAANILRQAEQTQSNQQPLDPNNPNNKALIDQVVQTQRKDFSRAVVSTHVQIGFTDLAMLGNNMLAVDRLEAPKWSDPISGYVASLHNYNLLGLSPSAASKQSFFGKLLADSSQPGNTNMFSHNEALGQQFFIDGASTQTLIDQMLSITAMNRPNNVLSTTLTIPAPIQQQQMLHQQYINIRKQQQAQQYSSSEQEFSSSMAQRAGSPFGPQLHQSGIFVPFHIHPSLYLPFPRHLPIYSVSDEPRTIFSQPNLNLQTHLSFASLSKELSNLVPTQNLPPSQMQQYVFGICPAGALNQAIISAIQHDHPTALQSFVESIDPTNIVLNVSSTSSVLALDTQKYQRGADVNKTTSNSNNNNNNNNNNRGEQHLSDKLAAQAPSYTQVFFQHKHTSSTATSATTQADDLYRLYFGLYTQTIIDRIVATGNANSIQPLITTNQSTPFDLTQSLFTALNSSIVTPQALVHLQKLLFSSQFLHILNPSSSLKLFNMFHLQSGQLAITQPHSHHQSNILTSPNTQFIQSPHIQTILSSATKSSQTPIPFAIRSIPVQLLTVLQWYHSFFAQNQPELTTYPMDPTTQPADATSAALQSPAHPTYVPAYTTNATGAKTIVIEKSLDLQAFLGTSSLSSPTVGLYGSQSQQVKSSTMAGLSAFTTPQVQQPITPATLNRIALSRYPIISTSSANSDDQSSTINNISGDQTIFTFDNTTDPSPTFTTSTPLTRRTTQHTSRSSKATQPTFATQKSLSADKSADFVEKWVQIPLTPPLITSNTLNQLHQFLLYLFYPKTHSVSLSPLSYIPSSSPSSTLSAQGRAAARPATQLSDATNNMVKQIGTNMLIDLGAAMSNEVDFLPAPPHHLTNHPQNASAKSSFPSPYEDLFQALVKGLSSQSTISVFDHNLLPPTVSLPSTPTPPSDPTKPQPDTTLSSMVNTIAMLYNYITNTPVSTSTTITLQPIDILHALLLSINPPLTASNATDIHMYKPINAFSSAIQPLSSLSSPSPSNALIDSSKLDSDAPTTNSHTSQPATSLPHPLSPQTPSNELMLYNPRYLGHLIHFILPLVNLWLQTTSTHPSRDMLANLYPPSALHQPSRNLNHRYNLANLVRSQQVMTNGQSPPIAHFLYCYNSLLSSYPQHVATALKIDQNQIRSNASQFILITRPQMLFFQQHQLYLNQHQRSLTLPYLFPLCSIQNSPLPAHTNNTTNATTFDSSPSQTTPTIQSLPYFSNEILHTASESKTQFFPMSYPYTPPHHLPHVVINPHQSTADFILPQTLLAAKKVITFKTPQNDSSETQPDTSSLDDIDNDSDTTPKPSSSSSSSSNSSNSFAPNNSLSTLNLAHPSTNLNLSAANLNSSESFNGRARNKGKKSKSSQSQLDFSQIPTLLTQISSQLSTLEQTAPQLNAPTHLSFYLAKLVTPSQHPESTKFTPTSHFNSKLISQGIFEPFIIPPPRPLTAQTTALAIQGAPLLNNAMIGSTYLVDSTPANPPQSLSGFQHNSAATANVNVNVNSPPPKSQQSYLQQVATNRYGVSSSPAVQPMTSPDIPALKSMSQTANVQQSHPKSPPEAPSRLLIGGNTSNNCDLVLPKQAHVPMPWYPKGQHCTTLTGHADTVTSMSVNDNNTLLATTSLDGSCRVYSTNHFAQSGHTIPLATLHAHPDTRSSLTLQAAQSTGPDSQPLQSPHKHQSVISTSTFLNQTDQVVLGTSSVDSSAVLIYDLNQLTAQPAHYLANPPNNTTNTNSHSQSRSTLPTQQQQQHQPPQQPQQPPSGLISRINIPGHVVSSTHATSISHSLLLLTNHHGGTFGWDPRMSKPVMSLQQPTIPHLTSSLIPSLTTHATLGPNPYSYITGTSNGTLFLYDLRGTTTNYNTSAITNIWQVPSATQITHLSTMNSASLFQSHPIPTRTNINPQNGMQYDVSHHSAHSPLICLGSLFTNELSMFDMYTGQTRAVFRTFDHNKDLLYSDSGSVVQDNEEKSIQMQQMMNDGGSEGTRNEQPLIALNYNTLMKYNGGIDLSYCYNTNNNNVIGATMMSGANDLGYPFSLHSPLSCAMPLNHSLAMSPYARLVETAGSKSNPKTTTADAINNGKQAWYQFKQDLFLSLYRGVSIQKPGHGITSVLASTQTGSNQTVPFVITGGYDGFVRFWNLADPSSSYHLCSPYWFGGNGYYHAALHQYQLSQGYALGGLAGAIGAGGTSAFTNTLTNNQLPINTIRQYQRYLQLYTHTSLHPHINQIRVPTYSTRQLNIAMKSNYPQPQNTTPNFPGNNGISDGVNNPNAIEQMYANMAQLHPSINNIFNMSSTPASQCPQQQTILCFNEEQMLFQRDYIQDQHSYLHNTILSPIVQSKISIGADDRSAQSGGQTKMSKELQRHNEVMKTRHGQLYSALYPDLPQHLSTSNPFSTTHGLSNAQSLGATNTGSITNNGGMYGTNASGEFISANSLIASESNIQSQQAAVARNKISQYYHTQYRSDQSIHNDFGHSVNSLTAQIPSQKQHALLYATNNGITHLSMVDSIANANKYFVSSTIAGDVNVWL